MQAADEAAHQRVIVTLIGHVRRQAEGLELGDQHLIVAVDQQAQCIAALRALTQANVADMEGKYLVTGQAFEARAHVEAVADQIGKGAADQRLGGHPQPPCGVLAGLENAQVAFVQDQQKPVGLDAAGHLDRLLGTALHGLGEWVVCSGQ
ncbi:hypothetical protein D3C80_1338080 [compost metagenome]